MEYNYTVFNPKKSRTAQEILNTPATELLKKYVRKKTSNKHFDSIFQDEVNKVDDEGYLINPNMYDIEGKNLNHVASSVNLQASKLKQLGYELKLNNVVRDLDRMFSEHLDEVEKINIESEIKPVSKDISNFFVKEVLANIVTAELEKIINHKL